MHALLRDLGFGSTWQTLLRDAKRSTVLLFCLMGAVSAPGQLAIRQLDYYQGGSLAVANSEWGQVDVQFTPSSGFQFLNVVLNPGTASERWAVQNLALRPSAQVGPGPFSTSMAFDLGVARGTDLTSLNLGYSFTSGALPAPGALTTGTFSVGTARGTINAGVPSGSTTLNAPSAPGANWGGPFDVSDETWHFGMPNVTQESGWCGPGAAANSLHWLDTQNNLGLTQTLEATQSELAGNMENNHDGNWDDKEVEGKLQYIIEHQLPLDVHYVGGEKLPTDSDYHAPNGNGGARNDGPITWEWLVREMARGQDIEVMTGTHWVVVEGTYSVGDRHFFNYRDDPFQHGDATTAEERDELDDRHMVSEFDNGIGNIGNGDEKLLAMVAESPVPEPSTYGLVGVGALLAAAAVRRWRRNSRG